MKLLITGSSGFLGTHLVKKLEQEGHEVIGINSKTCNLRISTSLQENFEGQKFDQIFHLAAWTQAGDFCLHRSGEQWIINQQINTNILDWWSKYQPQAKMIVMGTSCSYDPKLELKEENYMRGEPIESLFAYAQTKRMLYAGLKALNKQFGLEYICFIPSTLYGPGYHTDGRQMHFIFDLMRKILEAKYYGKKVILWGDGYQKRELVHVKDFIDIMLRINKKHKNELINIGAGKEYTIREFAKIICDSVDYDFNKIEFDISKYVGAKSKCLIIEKMKLLCPEFNFRNLKDGINQTLSWMIENKNDILKK